jgi:hypothetical protein
MKCQNCQYVGDKFSFEQPNNLLYVDENGKHFYCNCGDSKHYCKDVTEIKPINCDCFEEL